MKRARMLFSRKGRQDSRNMMKQQLTDKENKQQQLLQSGGSNNKRQLCTVAFLVLQITIMLVLVSSRKIFTTFAGMELKSSIPQDAPEQPSLQAPEGELLHVFFNDLKYRRVCSKVYHSILCLIIRYPFEVPLQDPSVMYPKPVDDRMYNISNLIMVEGSILETCRQSLQSSMANLTSRERIWQCLEKTSFMDPDAVVAIYTRQVTGATEEEWYGTGLTAQQKRLHQFFDQHVVIVLGDSLSRYVSFCMSLLFGHCELSEESSFRCGTNASMITPPKSAAAGGPKNVPKALSNDGPNYDVSDTDVNDIWLGFVYYMVHGGKVLRPAVNETESLMDTFRARGIDAGPSWRSKYMNDSSSQPRLRPMTILFEFPLAHSQTHELIQSNYDQVRHNQEKFTEMVMNITSPAARAELAELGFSLEHFIAFDGTPQHFPTESGAYADVRYQQSEAEFLQAKGYPGWRPEYGSTCRGPLTPNSTLKQINQISRQAFVTQGLDMTRWYGRTWEFSNQFWWQDTMWRVNQLDCTHPMSVVGGSVCAHRFFLQAMIDGYYEEKEQALLTLASQDKFKSFEN